MKRSEPIHFQFATDFGLRDGDWKAVSFKGQEWELYNIATDRTELVNVAESEPERLKAMVAKWKEMTLNVLHSERMANSEIQPAQDPKANREWTTYSDSVEPPVFQQKKAKPRAGIRARKNTKMIRKPGLLDLTFTGADPGIAMDLRSKKDLPAGPYVVSFELSTDWKGTGEIFYTIDEKTLPGGERVEFEVTGEKAQKIRIELKTQKVLKQLRIDVSDGKGAAVIGNLKLLGQDGKVLHDWTK